VGTSTAAALLARGCTVHIVKVALLDLSGGRSKRREWVKQGRACTTGRTRDVGFERFVGRLTTEFKVYANWSGVEVRCRYYSLLKGRKKKGGRSELGALFLPAPAFRSRIRHHGHESRSADRGQDRGRERT
jgi:hypothetical protein